MKDEKNQQRRLKRNSKQEQTDTLKYQQYKKKGKTLVLLYYLKSFGSFINVNFVT
jgi:hypothetical protein